MAPAVSSTACTPGACRWRSSPTANRSSAWSTTPTIASCFNTLRGHGAWLNDAPIRPHPATTVKEGVMGVGTSHRVTPADFLPFLQALLSDGGMFIRNGSGALMSAWAAAGRLIGYYEPHMNPWDALPGLVLMREAGGASNDFLAQEGSSAAIRYCWPARRSTRS
ncbi:inositol monophosphatase family protein [Klebsiella variicola]|nr:inositol monophosphatase family protein [Klebsiella variicola]